MWFTPTLSCCYFLGHSHPSRLKPTRKKGIYLVGNVVIFKLCGYISFDTTDIFRDISENQKSRVLRPPLVELTPTHQELYYVVQWAIMNSRTNFQLSGILSPEWCVCLILLGYITYRGVSIVSFKVGRHYWKMVDDYNKSDFIFLRFLVKIRSSPRFEFPIVAPLMITPYTINYWSTRIRPDTPGFWLCVLDICRSWN